MFVCLLLHFRSYLFLPNLPKLLSTKQTDTVENVTAGPGGGEASTGGGRAKKDRAEGDARERTGRGGLGMGREF
jgi:hypothetical protein